MARARPARFCMPPLICDGKKSSKPLQADQSELQRRELADLRRRQVGVLAQRQADVLRQRHRAPQRAALVQHAEAPQHLLPRRGLRAA